MAQALLHSPLELEHVRLGGRLVPFAGWSMPVQYSSITEEHHAVRRSAGIFDISHMGEFFVSGPGAAAWLDGLLTNRLSRLQPGQGQYTLLLNEQGGVIDDLIIYRLDAEEFFLVVNAGCVARDEEWMRARLPAEGVVFQNRSFEFAALALQGPRTTALLESGFEGWDLPPRNGVRAGGSVIVCRTGYTGEDGVEIFCPVMAAAAWFQRFLDAGARPCGLGARDTLRLEMGYPLNGADLTPERTPLEAGLGRFVDLEKDFTGAEVLRRQKGTPHDRLCGLRMTAAGPPPRAHYAVLHHGEKVGELTSGGIAPSLGGAGIGMAYVPAALARPGTRVEIDVRGRPHPAEVVARPFYRPGASPAPQS